MSKIKKNLFILLVFSLFSFSFQECVESKNNCAICNPFSNLCVKCEKSIYKPDIKGGCELSKTCVLGQNYCNECNIAGNLCSLCENGHYPDKNGGCSTTDNCEVSFKGECLQCNEDYYLVGSSSFKFCKYKYAEDFKNCKKIDSETGLCKECNNGFYMSTSDKKCIETDHCEESLYGICTLCKGGYYLDKRDDTCKDWKLLTNCKISLDGEVCDECLNGFYLSEDGKCVITNFCEKSDKSSKCIKCIKNYFISQNICTNDENCNLGNKDFGICTSCKSSFYLDADQNKCISNQENNDFKNCFKAESGICTSCISSYSLTEDSKCIQDKNCLKTENDICIKCKENYHLDIDNYCTDIDKCISATIDGGCLECEKGYYYE